MAKMQGDISHRDIKPITLESLEEPDPRTQFEGEVGFQRDAPHPSLYNRDVFAFFPFQCTKTRYVIPVYVMTRNMSLLYKSDAPVSDVTRFDMPEETFRLRLSGISGNPTLKLYDPLDGSEHDVKTLEHRGSRMRIELAVTDSPRLLIIEE